MDINIKGDMDGIKVAVQIRSHFNIPSIFITGYSDKEMEEKAEMAKPVGIFIKPLNFDKLRLTIDSFFISAR
jgi:CheY-like chemotaxis protein